jgi:hypothetical protein
MLVGRKEECLHALARLHARGDTTDPFVIGEFEDLNSKVSEEAANEWGWMQVRRRGWWRREAWTESLRTRQMFGDASVVRRIMLGIILQFSVQMTGVSVIQYYAP